MKRKFRIYVFFMAWFLLAVVAAVLNGLNMKWENISVVSGVSVLFFLSIIQGSVLEIAVQVFVTFLWRFRRRRYKTGNGRRYKLVINFNLLAHSVTEVDECFKNMYDAYMGNIGPNISAVLVSATKEEYLKEYECQVRNAYRRMVFDEVYTDGLSFARQSFGNVESLKFEHIWMDYRGIRRDKFIEKVLYNVSKLYARDFMLLHRESSVLRKCGQYQDLMLLSEGYTTAFTYCDMKFYSSFARKKGQDMFAEDIDIHRIKGRKYDFTFVLDADTKLPKNTVFQLLDIAAAYPERGMLQPRIDVECGGNDPLFMHLESSRQAIYTPMANSLNRMFGQCSFCGKGLIRNKAYIENVIGHEDSVIERVPVDVLSHDTYEATILRPLYIESVGLKEQPPFNYISWNIRERRWNKGEIINAMYFWPRLVGVPMRWLQQIFQRKKYVHTKHRTKTKLDILSSYIAHSAIRQMVMKPLLLIYILIHVNIDLHYDYAPLIAIMCIIIILPKFVLCTRKNYKLVLIESVASILQFTPEAIVGVVRIARAFSANIFSNVKWVPSRQVEEEFRNSNPFVKSLIHLGGYSLCSIVIGIFIIVFRPDGVLAYFMLITVFFLPIFNFVTTLSPSQLRCRRCCCTSNKVSGM